MAHLTLIKPIVSPRAGRLSYIDHSKCDLRQTTSQTLLNVRVVMYTVINIDAGWLDEDHDPFYIAADAILMMPDDADKLEPRLIDGFTFSTHWHDDGRMYRALHLDPHHLKNMYDAVRFQSIINRTEINFPDNTPGAWAYDGQNDWSTRSLWERPFEDGDYIVNSRNSCIIKCLGDVFSAAYARRPHMRLTLDIQNDNDYIDIHRDIRACHSYMGVDRINSSPAFIYDSKYPALGFRAVSVSRYGYDEASVSVIMHKCRLRENVASYAVVSGIDKNTQSHAINAFRRALCTTKEKLSLKNRDSIKKSGRWTVLDDDPISFPLATRCNEESINWRIGGQVDVMAFFINRKTGAYRIAQTDPWAKDEYGKIIEEESKQYWLNRDFMLMHRSVDKWRFIFGCHSEFVPALGSRVSMVALIPYTVEDNECSVKPRAISPQRGMPKDVARAIRDTPYCAAAINHATSRLRYLTSSIPLLGDEIQYGNVDVDAGNQKAPILWRPKVIDTLNIRGPHTTNRSSVARAKQRGNWNLDDVLTTELRLLPDSDVTFADTVEVDIIDASIYELPKARALCLDD